MKPRKCPRCELNYILDGEELCPVCRKAFSRSEPDELENICIECGTNPALPGEDYCQSCLAAKRRAERENAQQDAQEREDDGSDEMREDGGMEDLEIEIPDDELTGGVWRLTGDGGELAVTRATSPPTATLTVGGFSALLYGVLDPVEVTIRGLGTAPAEAVEALSSLFPRRMPYLFTDF